MLISCNKLKSHIKNPEDIDWLNIWETFTIRTAEVEKVEVKGNTFDNVVVAEIKECEEHPDSDHMHVLKVDCGEGTNSSSMWSTECKSWIKNSIC